MTDQYKAAIFEFLQRTLGVPIQTDPLLWFNYLLDNLVVISDQAAISAFVNSEKEKEKQELITSLETQLDELKK